MKRCAYGSEVLEQNRLHGLFVVLRRIKEKTGKRERRFLVIATSSLLVSTLLIAASPILFAVILDIVAAEKMDSRGLVIFIFLFFSARFIGQIPADIRWITVNPLLYRIVYRFCLDLCKIVIEQEKNLGYATIR